MEDQFPQQLGGSSTRSATAIMYFPSSTQSQSPRLHHHSPNPNPSTSLQTKPETRPGSTHNPYGRNSHDEDDVIKAKIVSHPHYSALLGAYLNCQTVGAPAEVGERLSVIAREIEARQQASLHRDAATSDPELDQFMEAYCNMLVKYREELTRPLQEAMDFLRSVESQLNALTNGAAGSVFSAGMGLYRDTVSWQDICQWGGLYRPSMKVHSEALAGHSATRAYLG